MHRTPQMILRLRLSSARVGWQSSQLLLGPGGSRLTVPRSSTVSGASRPLKGQHNFLHGVAKRSSSAYEAAASDQPVSSSDSSIGSAPLGAAEVAADAAPLPSSPQDQSGDVGGDEGCKFGELEGPSPHPPTPIDSTLLVIPSPNGGAPVKISMPQSTAEAIATSKAIQEKEAQSAQMPLSRNATDAGADESATLVASAAKGEMENPPPSPRTLLVRTPDAYPLKVTVPSTTAEAVAMNRSIQEKTMQNIVARERTSAETEPARSPDIEEGGNVTGTKLETAKVQKARTPKEMVVTPTARSKSLKIPVPTTTAEAMAMNKAMRSRFREAVADQSPTPGRSTGWVKSRKRRGGEGKFAGLTISEKNNPLRDGDGGGGSGSNWAEGWTGEAAAKQEGSRVMPSTTMSGDKSFDRTILELSRNMQWSQIIRVWQEIEEREKEGIKVSLGPQAYEDLMSALIEHPDVSVVAECGSVFDHLISSGADVKPVLCNLYMKGCSLAKLGTRAVALMEALDQLPGKKFKPNPHFFYNLLTATSAEGLVKESKLYYGLMRDMGFVANNRVFQNLTDMYLEAGEVLDALMVFEHTHQAGHKSRDALANKLMYTCIRHGDPELMHEALDLLQITGNSVLPLTVQNVLYMATRKRDSELATKMWVAAQGWGHSFSDVDYSFTVQAFMSAGKDEMGLATLVQAYKEGRKVSRKTLTFCAQRLSISNNRLDGAYYTLASLKQDGELVPVEAVNTVIVGCAIRQGVDRCFSTAEALPVVFELQPNLDTYNALMHVLGNMRKQETQNASLGIGMSLLDKMESEGVKPDQETFISLVDLACMSEGFSEAVADDLVERMTSRYDLRLDQDIVDTLASAFHNIGQEGVAQAWASKLPPLDGEPSSLGASPDHVALPRPRRNAEERGRYTGFDDSPFSRGSGIGNQRHYGRGGSRGGDRPQRNRLSSERFSREGPRGHVKEEELGRGDDADGVAAVPEEGGNERGGETVSTGWSDRYTGR